MATLLSASGCSTQKPFPSYRTPSVIAEFSVTKERDVVRGRIEAKYFCNKILQHGTNLCLDLSEGFETFESKDQLLSANEKLDVLCKWLMLRTLPSVGLRSVCCEADFVCYRGLLTRIASTPYEINERWIIAAVRMGSTIFLCEFPTDEKKKRIETMTEREKLMCYWGFKFEQLVTADTPNSIPITDEPVCNLKEFDVVMMSKIGNEEDGIRVLFSAETDCLDANGDYLELKTQANGLVGNFWMNKAMKWWIQSFLAGIRNIVVGFRNNSGIVDRVGRIKVSELYRNAAGWTPTVIFNFLLDTLKLIKEKISEAENLEYMLFEYLPSEHTVTFRKVPEGDDYAQFLFLPNRFVEHFSGRFDE